LNSPITKQSRAFVSVLYVGPRKDLDFSSFPATTVTLGSYTLTSFGASIRLGGPFEIFGRVENVFNESYEQVKGFGAVGRSAFIGGKVSL
jgi:vitamin B12 transporter